MAMKQTVELGLRQNAAQFFLLVLVGAMVGIAAHYGLRPQPFYLGVAFVGLGLFLSTVLATRRRTSPTSRA
jgi:hypothetical protein